MQGTSRSWLVGAGVLVVVVTTYAASPLLFRAALLAVALLLGAGLSLLQGTLGTRRRATYPTPSPLSLLDGVLSRVKVFSPPTMRPVLLTPNVDGHVERILDLLVEHHAAPTYAMVAERHAGFFDSVLPQAWGALGALVDRARQIDAMKLVSQNMVNCLKTHFEHFRGVDFRSKGEVGPLTFRADTARYPYLESREGELDFLRKCCDVLLCACLPRDVSECAPLRVLLAEFLVARVIRPAVDSLCDPDNVNQMLVSYFAGKEEKAQALKSSQSWSFEDYIKHINRCDDSVELQQIRQNIITEIVQVKAVEKMKSSWTTGGLHGGNFPIPIPAEKAKSLVERDLGVYTTQLATAKTACERQLRKIGGQDYQHDITVARQLMEAQSRRRALPRMSLLDVLSNEAARGQLQHFLECSGHAHLVRFWKAADDVRSTPTHVIHLRLRGIYDEFLSPTAPYSLYVDPELTAEIERYLKYETDCYEEALTKLGESVCTELSENFYEEFLQSKHYHELVTSGKLFGTNLTTEGGDAHGGEDTQHQQKLEELRAQLGDKLRALEAIPPVGEDGNAQLLEPRRKALERDVSTLRANIKKLENYITSTVKWFDTIGQWSVEIVDTQCENDERDPLFTIVVQRPEISLDNLGSQQPSSGGENKGGWVIGRTLTEFEALHAKLETLDTDLQFPSPPAKWLNPFTTSTTTWKKYSKSLEAYLRYILRDRKLQECEAVFNFLSSAVESLRNTSLLGFKEQHEDPKEDSIFEPIYLLAREIFELDDWSQIIRKQSLELVHLTYGKNLDQQFQESLAWMVSEPMLVYYLEWFRDRWWPGGKPAPETPPRGDEEKKRTREEARRRVLDSVPQVLQVLLGQDNTQLGYRKFFEVLQNGNANRQLFYSLFEQLLIFVVPELDSRSHDDVS